jgi:hypothetical protein
MFGSQVLDVAIGLVFVYLLLSSIVSVVQEWIAQLTAMRSATLELAIKNMLNDPHASGLARDVFEHSLVKGMGRRDFVHSLMHRPGMPSYIPARVFSRALLDSVMAHAAKAAPVAASEVVSGAQVLAATGATAALTPGPAAAVAPPATTNGVTTTGTGPSVTAVPLSLQDVRAAIMTLNQFPEVQKALLSLMDESQYSVQDFRKNIETWFNDSMDRVSGWYKRWTQVIILGIAILVTLVVNVDSIAIGSVLWNAPTTRAAVASAAQQYAVKTPPSPDNFQQRVVDLQTNLASLELPIGWSANARLPGTFQGWLLAAANKVPGWLLTILAISLGAPFWFDLLNKLMSFRSSGKPPTDGTT